MQFKYDKILLKTIKYNILCEAGVRQDMAKRVMYSIIPSVADPLQIKYTGGVVDYNALKSAIEGRHDIIKYGVNAAVTELKHYHISDDYIYAKEALANNDIEKAIKIAINAYSDYNRWSPGYGGRAWEQISRTLERIIILDKELKKIDPDAKDRMNKEIQIMQMIIVELNVFDGLSHNTKSIMYNIIEEEMADNKFGSRERGVDPVVWLSPSDMSQVDSEMEKVIDIMDAKELSKPVDVYKKIENTLVESGDIHRYKQWNTKLRESQDYRKQNKDLDKELFMIKFRKKTIKTRQIFADAHNKLSSQLDWLDSQQLWDKNSFKRIKWEYEDEINNNVIPAFLDLSWYLGNEIAIDMSDDTHKLCASIKNNLSMYHEIVSTNNEIVLDLATDFELNLDWTDQKRISFKNNLKKINEAITSALHLISSI